MTQAHNNTLHNYNVSQLRINTWNSLKHTTREITRIKEGEDGHQSALDSISNDLNQLSIIEKIFCFSRANSR